MLLDNSLTDLGRFRECCPILILAGAYVVRKEIQILLPDIEPNTGLHKLRARTDKVFEIKDAGLHARAGIEYLKKSLKSVRLYAFRLHSNLQGPPGFSICKSASAVFIFHLGLATRCRVKYSSNGLPENKRSACG